MTNVASNRLRFLAARMLQACRLSVRNVLWLNGAS